MAENFSQSEFIGEARIVGTLFDLGDYPGVAPNDEGVVLGELYKVDGATLKKLDEFEATAGYYRSRTSARVDGHPIDCWIYCPERERLENAEVITSGDWIQYLHHREQKKAARDSRLHES